MEINWLVHPLYLLLAFLLLCVELGEAARDKSLYCSACRAVIDEMNYAISKVDPKKTIQVGSFRVDPSGNQDLYQVPLARSETHITETIETICSKMSDYAQTVDKATGKQRFVRMNSRDGGGIELSNINLSGDIQKGLKFACESFVEDYEEDLITLLRDDEAEIETKICVQEAEYCEEEDLLIPLVNIVDPNSNKEDTDNIKPNEETEYNNEESTDKNLNDATEQGDTLNEDAKEEL
ncbi:unnamed protein product [Owenia fusiformis]|uniref:Uncharacterized protein n=1 Tax=Owenia fusiformis TaxID=6347 RepID=A0A8J1URF2_OWEFU|nr:unnamed protein product [Owenia fusiformis]